MDFSLKLTKSFHQMACQVVIVIYLFLRRNLNFIIYIYKINLKVQYIQSYSESHIDTDKHVWDLESFYIYEYREYMYLF